MGSFISTTYSATTESIVKGYQNRVGSANPYFKFINHKPTQVTYWNINTKKTTLDQGTEQPYDQLTDEDPIRYNRINGFYLYGLGSISADTSIGEYGLEANIDGTAYILPNTIIPLEGDYFTINYLLNGDKTMLFRVTSTNIDTLENGSNFYKITYKLDQTKTEHYEALLKQTIKTFKYIASTAGTNFLALLDEETEQSIQNLFGVLSVLRNYYINLFYRRNIQTFVYPYKDASMLIYDPYLIEFLIRNKVFDAQGDEYLYISQATFKSSTFAIEYMNTLFINIEQRKRELSLNTVYPIQICDPNSLLVDRMEEYLELSVQRQNYNFYDPINFLDMDLFDRIVNGTIYDEEDESLPIYRNIIINFMNKKAVNSITSAQLRSLERIHYTRTKDLFYEIPLISHILNTYITDMMTRDTTSGDQTGSTTCRLEHDCFANGK